MYAVSSLGRVYSFHRGGRYLKAGVASNGYLSVVIRKGNTRTVHSLAADAFLGPCPEGQIVRHLDDNRLNPRLDNLAHGTKTQNIEDSIRNGQWFSERRRLHLATGHKALNTPEAVAKRWKTRRANAS